MSDLLRIYKELQAKKWVDLSHQINAESPHFPALPALQQEDLFTLKDLLVAKQKIFSHLKMASMFKNLQWLVNTERILMLRFTL